MTDEELEALLGDLESQRVERKPSEKQGDSIRKAICAFANDLPDYGEPGLVFVGVKDDGSSAGLAVTDELLRTLADMRSDGNILPLPRMSVEKRTLKGREIAVVIVHPSDAPPVHYKGRAYVRVGPSNRVATQAEESALNEKRRSRDLPFDLHPLSTATTSDIDTDWFSLQYLPSAVSPEELEVNARNDEQRLLSLRFLSPPPECTPTVLALLVAGKDPRAFLPCAYVQFIRFDGLELTDPIKDQKEITGKVADVLEEVDEVFKAHISVAADLRSRSTEIRQPDYPIVALQQLSRNAILHRTYEVTNAPVRVNWFNDRIEIQNPGGPFGQVNAMNFGQPGATDYRNPHLAEALRNLGYVQRFGIGIQIARRELEKNGNPPPEFVVETSHVLALVRRRP